MWEKYIVKFLPGWKISESYYENLARNIFNMNVRLYYVNCAQFRHAVVIDTKGSFKCLQSQTLSQNTADNVNPLQVEGSMKFGNNAELEPDTPDGKLMDLDSISSTQLARHV